MGWFSSSSFNTAKSCSCFYENLVGTCSSCEYMNPKNYVSGMFSGYKYKCTKRGSYFPWNDKTCSSLREIDPEKVDCVERYKNLTGRRYFILTAIFEILGISLDSPLYKKIQEMIQFVREDANTEILAIEYDIVGMDIANCLRKDNNKEEICNNLLENYIVKIYALLGLNKNNEAITLYKQMVKELFRHYNNKEKYAKIIDTEIFKNSKIKIK